MAKYHIKDNGEPGRCTAFLRPCPLGASDEEHYASPEAAREAYEASMATAVPEAASKPAPRANVPAPETPEQRAWAADFLADYRRIATPEELDKWATDKPNSFRERLFRLSVAHEKGEYTDYEFANIASGMAAGERAGVSSRARKWAEDLVTVRTRAQQAEEYDQMLAGMELEGQRANPFAPDRKHHSPETYEQALAGAREELKFLAPFTHYWDNLYHNSSEATSV